MLNHQPHFLSLQTDSQEVLKNQVRCMIEPWFPISAKIEWTEFCKFRIWLVILISLDLIEEALLQAAREVDIEFFCFLKFSISDIIKLKVKLVDSQ